MATHKTKPNYVDAIQFNGTNGADIQKIAGVHCLDAAGVYPVPNFDYASYWWPTATEDIVAVLWSGTGWLPVRVGDYLFRDNQTGQLGALSQTDFENKYEVA